MSSVHVNSGLTASRVIARPSVVRRIEKYPIRRGLSGHLFYCFGMSVNRLCIRLRAEGLENIPRQIPYVIAANHETYVDGLWIGSFLPRTHFKALSCIAAKELEDRHGILGRMIVKVGRAISVDRFGNPVRGLIIARKAVDEGNIMLVHPEGTRTHDGRLGEMKDGAAYIAMKSKVPLLPVFIDGGYEVFNRYMKVPQGWNPVTRKQREVILTFGKPLQPAEFRSARDMTYALGHWMQMRFRDKKIPRAFISDSF
jgi:1-acyl-sn-glycerol-3-phosphate acyltransferase